MRISFRQGVVSHQPGGFLALSGSGNISLLASSRPVTVTIAHQGTNYTHTENNSVSDAWMGPFPSGSNYWIYWDFNLLTFERTFGRTNLEPVAQSVPPGNGDVLVSGVVAGAPGIGAFVVPDNFVLPAGKIFEIIGSSGNDGVYTVASSAFNGFTGETTIVVNETVPSSVADGLATLDIDSYNQPLRQVGRHWYDTANNKHFVWMGSYWSEVLRVFAAHVVNGNTFLPQSITGGSFVGTQIGNTSSVLSGRVLFDESSKPLRRDNRTFFTTEDQFFANAARVDAIRLESNVARAQFPFEMAVAQFAVVAWKEDGKAQTAQYDDIGTTVLGILTEDVLSNEVGAVVIQGVVTNPSWNWTQGSGAVPVGTPLWVENGALVPYDPHLMDNLTYPIGRVPVARVLSVDTVVFEQGLGGKGDQGPPGSIESVPPASPTAIGGVTLTVPSSVPELALVPSDNDPRLTDARPPLPHTHQAPDISFTPGAGITSNNVEGALLQLGNTKLNKSGGTMTGFLTLNSNPTASLHAATKQYVDGLVSGLVWLDPICLENMISDSVTTPPVSPSPSDAYIVPPGATGAWSAIPAGHVVVWDGAAWIDEGTITNINPNGARFGISMTSSAVASGSFAGRDNQIALFNNTGALTGFQIPTSQNAVYVCNAASVNAFNQYAFTGTDWILFGGGQAVTGDGTTIVQSGNSLSVKPYSAGGTADARSWQGLVPSDLNALYSPIGHNHSSASITVTPYTSSGWGTPTPSTTNQITSTTLQLALQELMDKKAPKSAYYLTLASLPSAATVHGMLAHVHSEGKMYFSHDGAWVPLASNDGTVQDHDHVLPYDVTFFIAGPAANIANKTVGMYVATRTITITGTAPNLQVYTNTPPTSNVTFRLVKNGNIGSPVGFVTVAAGSNVANSSSVTTTTFTLSPGDRLELVSPATTEATIANVAVSIVACANMGTCPEAAPLL